jgi:hypothetical protein
MTGKGKSQEREECGRERSTTLPLEPMNTTDSQECAFQGSSGGFNLLFQEDHIFQKLNECPRGEIVYTTLRVSVKV